MSNHHFDNDPQPPEPFVLDISDPDTAWPHFKRYMGFAGQIAELQSKVGTLEASIVELKAQLATKVGFRVIGGTWSFQTAPTPIDGPRDEYLEGEGE